MGSAAGDVRGGRVGSWAMIVRNTLRFGRALGRSGRVCTAACLCPSAAGSGAREHKRSPARNGGDLERLPP